MSRKTSSSVVSRAAEVMKTLKKGRFDVVLGLAKLDQRRILAVLGSHNVSVASAASMLVDNWKDVVDMVGFEPVCLVTGCWAGGVEKAARIVARTLTGRTAVVMRRNDDVPGWTSSMGDRAPERWRDIMMAQAATSLLLVTSGNNVCEHVRDRFAGWGKQVHEIEVEV